MANQITDNRTNVTTAESTTGWTDLTGAASGATVDNEIFIQGSNSLGEYSTNSLFGQMYNFGATDVSNQVFYIWIYCTVVGFLNTKASGGFRIRFAGSTIGDFFEVYVAGSDDWPTAIEGGWVQFVVDIEQAHANSSNTGGTKPNTNQVQRVGWASLCSSMPRMVDNTWVDQIARVPNTSPGIIIEGRNGGTTDWDFDDIVTQLGTSVGTFLPNVGGSYKCNTPIQFGINDTTTHGFSQANATLLMETQQFVADGFMSLSALGNSGGTTNVLLDTVVVQSDGVNGADWDIDFSDTNLDSVQFLGCNMINVGNAVLGPNLVVTGTRIDALDVTQGAAQVEGDSRLVSRAATNVALMNDATFGATTGLNNMSFSQSGAGHAISIDDTVADAVFNSPAGTAADNATSISPAWPTHAIDDIGIMAVETQSGVTPTLSVANGFVQLASVNTTTDTRLTVYWARATSAAMSAPTVTGTDHLYGVIVNYRGCRTTGNPYDAFTTSADSTSDTSVSFPTITTLYQNQLVVGIGSRGNDAAGAEFSAITNANLSSITERFDDGTVTGDGGGLVIFDASGPATAGATGVTTATQTNSSERAHVMIALANEESERTLTELTYTGFGADGAADAVIDIQDTTGQYLFNISGGNVPTIKTDGAGWRTLNTVNVTLNNIKIGSECLIYETADPSNVIMALTADTATETVSYNYLGDLPITIRVRKASTEPQYLPYEATGTITNSGFSLNVAQIEDLIFNDTEASSPVLSRNLIIDGDETAQDGSDDVVISATVASGTEKLVVAVTIRDFGERIPDSVTWNGTSMTSAAPADNANQTGAVFYFLDDPDSGTHNLVVSGTEAWGSHGVWAWEVDGASNGGPDDTDTDTSTGASSSSLLTLTHGGSEAILLSALVVQSTHTITDDGDAVTEGTALTSIHHREVGFATGAGSLTAGFSWTGTWDFSLSAVIFSKAS